MNIEKRKSTRSQFGKCYTTSRTCTQRGHTLARFTLRNSRRGVGKHHAKIEDYAHHASLLAFTLRNSRRGIGRKHDHLFTGGVRAWHSCAIACGHGKSSQYTRAFNVAFVRPILTRRSHAGTNKNVCYMKADAPRGIAEPKHMPLLGFVPNKITL